MGKRPYHPRAGGTDDAIASLMRPARTGCGSDLDQNLLSRRSTTAQLQGFEGKRRWVVASGEKRDIARIFRESSGDIDPRPSVKWTSISASSNHQHASVHFSKVMQQSLNRNSRIKLYFPMLQRPKKISRRQYLQCVLQAREH